MVQIMACAVQAPMVVYRRICASLGLNELKASRQISALQRLTGLLGLPSKKAIYSSVIFSDFNYCYWCGFSPVGHVLLKCKNSGNAHLISFLKILFLITKHCYPRLVLILSNISIKIYGSGNLQHTEWNGSQISITFIY